jgi:integrase
MQQRGYVFKDKSGNWWARFTHTDKISGKRKFIKRRAIIDNSEKGALKILSELLDSFEQGGAKAIAAARMTFNDLADYYASHYVQAAEFIEGRKVSGLKDWKKVDSFLKLYREHFGRMLLSEIDYDAVRDFRLKRLRTPTHRKSQRTITTVNRELTYLRRVFNIAVRKNWIKKNPFNCGDSLISVAAEKKRQRIITREEEEKLLAACCGKWSGLRLIVLCALDTGMRHKEMLTLTRGNVDLENGLVTLLSQHTKTETTRVVALTRRLWDEFRSHLADVSDPNAKVFRYQTYVNYLFAEVRDRADLPDVRIHDLRHTFATRAAKRLELSQLGNVLGHTQIQTTFRYVNADVEVARRAAEAVEPPPPDDPMLILSGKQEANQAKAAPINERQYTG